MTVELMNDVDIEICVALLMKEWGKRYKRVFKFEYNYNSGDSDRIKKMVKKWGYERTFISMMGAVRLYPEVWRSDKFKWLSINQVYTWIGYEVWRMYKNKEFTVRIVRPNGVVTEL